MTKYIAWLLVPLIFLNAFALAAETEITLKNGDRLSGKIVSKNDETVVIETEYAGKVTIVAAHVEKITELRSKSANLGTAKVPEPIKAAPVAPNSAVSEQEPPRPRAVDRGPRLFGGRFMGIAEGWEGNANIGFSYTTGNSRTSTMTTGIRAVKTGGRDKLTVYARSLWYSNRNAAIATTQNAVWGGARYDRNLGDRTFGFGSYDFERDRPKKLYFRSVLGGGIGRHMVKNEKTEIDVLAGGAWNRTWQVGPNTDTPEILAGNTLKHQFNGRLKFQQTFTFFQNATDRNEFRFLFDSSVSADITKRVGLQFTIGNRFNNDPAGNAKRNDFLFATGLRWNFGKKK